MGGDDDKNSDADNDKNSDVDNIDNVNEGVDSDANNINKYTSNKKNHNQYNREHYA